MPRAASVGVAAEGFEVVVESAELGEVFEFGDLRSAEGVAVVAFEVVAHVAPGNDARVVPDLEGAAEMGGDGVAAVRHRCDVDAFGQEDLENGIFAQLAGQGDRNRSEPGISHFSPATVWPRISASRSATTWTMLSGPAGPPLS